MTGKELKEIREGADFYGRLFDYKSKGSEVEALGKDELDGTPVYKLTKTTAMWSRSTSTPEAFSS